MIASSKLPALAKWLACAAVLMTCDARATPRPPVSGGAADSGCISPDAIRVASDSPLARARQALAGGDAEGARRLAEGALGRAVGLETGRLLFVAARAAAAAGDAPGAIALLDRLVGLGTHPLVPWARLVRAEALETVDPARAATEAAALATMPWAAAPRARRLEARAVLAAGRVDEALPKLRAVLDSAGDAASFASVAMPLADHLASRTNDADAQREALSLYRRIANRSLRAPSARAAEEKLAAVLAALPEATRAAAAELSVDEALARANALAAAGRNAEAETAYDDVLGRMRADDRRICDVRFARGRVVERGRDRMRIGRVLTELADACPAPEVRAWALYKAGRAYQAARQGELALAVYARLEREAPAHRLADDASYLAAMLDRDAGRLDAMRERLGTLAERYPNGDMRGEALFHLGWQARKDGDHAAAAAFFARQRALVGVEEGEDLLGRGAYWEARELAELGRTSDAVAAYVALVNALPLSYYAQHALARLDELAPARATELRAALRSERDEPVAFLRKPGYDLPALYRAMELLVVGAIDEATAELGAFGALGDDADDERAFLAASLYEAAGQSATAIRLVRKRLAAFRSQAPVGTARVFWRVAYPRAFAPLVEDTAAREGVPAPFVRAIAREESSFDPGALSHAQAYGLIQIILPTARGQASALGMEPTPENLREPETNLRFGTHFMSFLLRRYGDNPALVPPAYNAGHGAVDRWLRQDSARPFDAFVEEIPYEETRRYTRRVLQTYGVYSVLDGDGLPALPQMLPSR